MPFGLHNQGTTCYLNSILQSLFHCRKFRYDLKQCAENAGEINSITVLDSLFDEMETHTAETTAFTKSMGIDPFVQEDASEFLLKLFSALESIDKRSTKSFYFKIESGVENKVETPFVMLNIQPCGTVMDGIDEFLRDEEVEYEGEMLIKTSRFTDLPDHLIINLKRWDEYHEKSRDGCGINRTLCLRGNIYGIRSICIHKGSADGGHYYCYVYYDDQWFRFNDSIVTESDENEIFNDCTDVYMMFYSRL